MRETRSGSGGNRGNDNGLASDTKGKKEKIIHSSFVVGGVLLCCVMMMVN